MADQADDDDDYDVIYENSPLYWSLVNAGLGTVGGDDVCGREESASHIFTARPLSSTDPGCSQKHTHYLPCIKHWLWKWLFHPESYNTVHQESRRGLFDSLSSSSLLNEEDASFLASLHESQQWTETASVITSTRTLWCCILLVVGVAISVTASCLQLDFWMIAAANTVTALFLPVLIGQVAAFSLHRRAKHSCKKLSYCVDEFLSAASKSMETVSKGIRFIQESELVARGFTFVGSMSTARVLKEMQSMAKQRQCPGLRQQVFFTARAQFVLFRQFFAHLVHLCPVSMEISGVMRYCSEIPLSHYPDIVQLDITGTEAMPKLLEMTDGFTIDILKSLHELNRIHISEFIRRLAVSFLVEGTDAQFTSLQQLLHALTTDLGGHRKELQSCLDAHRHSSVSSVLCDTKMTKWHPPASASHLQQSYQAVHSLELHLLAALRKIQDIGKTMEKNVDTICSLAQEDEAAKQAGEIDQSQREHWNGLLNLVRAELNACLGCLEEGAHHLEGKSTTDENAASLKISQAQPEKKTSGAKFLKVSADDDPIIQDEVFEGYSEPQEYGTRGDVCDVTSAEEEAWRKKKKRALRMCLSELGAIIAVRAADRQERERMALVRMKQGTHNVEMDEGATGCRFQSGEQEGLDRVKKRTPDAVQVGAEMGHRFSRDDHEDFERMTKGTLNAVNERGQMEHGFSGDEEKDVEMNICDATRREAGSVCLGEGDDTPSADERADIRDCSTDVQESLTVFRNNETVQQNVCIERKSMEKLEQTVNSSLDQPVFPRTQLEVDCEANIRSVQESSRLDSELAVDDVSKTLPSNSRTGASAEPLQVCVSDVTAASGNSESSTTVRQSVILDLTAKGCKVQNHRPAHNTDLISEDLSHNAAPVLDLSHESVSSEEDSDFDQRVHKSSHRRHPQYRSKPENIEEHLSLPAAPSPFASMVASRARNLTHAVETFGDSASDTDEQDLNNCDGGIIR